MSRALKKELDKPIVKYGLALGLVILSLQNIVIPWLEWREEQHGLAESNARLLVSKEELASAIEQLDASQKVLDEALSDVKENFAGPLANAKVELPTRIRDEAREFDISVNRVSVAELESDVEQMNRFMLTLEAESSVDSTMRFLSKLERQEDFYVVERLTLYGVSRDKIKVRMDLVKYVRK